MNQAAKAPAIVGSKSTRTASCGVIRPDPEARAVSTPLKVANPSGYQQIIRQRREMGARLNILTSAVQSRPSPPLFSQSCLGLPSSSSST